MTETTTTDKTEIQADTLRGDLRDKILTEFKHMPKPWQQMSEDEQSRIINRARDIADTCVRSSIDIIAAKGLPSLPIKVGKVTLEGSELKGTFDCYADDENLLRIRHLQGARAMFVLASPDAYKGERTEPKADPDEPALPLNADGTEQRADEEQLQQVGRGKGRRKRAGEGDPADGNEPAPDMATTGPDTSDRPFAPADDPLDIPPHLDRRKKADAA